MAKNTREFSGSFPKPLSSEEERKYTQLYVSGDAKERKHAFDTLVTRNLRLVAHIAKKYNHKECDDIISIGTLGLIKAVATFNPSHGAKLSTYASRCIDNEILMDWRASRRAPPECLLADSVSRDKEGNEVTYLEKLQDDSVNVDEEVVARSERDRLVEAIDACLFGREKEIILQRFGLFEREEKTQRELGKEFGISRSYVSRIEKKALNKLLIHYSGGK